MYENSYTNADLKGTVTVSGNMQLVYPTGVCPCCGRCPQCGHVTPPPSIPYTYPYGGIGNGTVTVPSVGPSITYTGDMSKGVATGGYALNAQNVGAKG